jgi:hypothetical protein
MLNSMVKSGGDSSPLVSGLLGWGGESAVDLIAHGLAVGGGMVVWAEDDTSWRSVRARYRRWPEWRASALSSPRRS